MSVARPGVAPERPLASVRTRLEGIVGSGSVRLPSEHDLTDETETRGIHGRADLVVAPNSAAEVAAVVSVCYDAGIPITPRGGGTGFAGGAVPVSGGVVLLLERLNC